jgi:hypothetical protein
MSKLDTRYLTSYPKKTIPFYLYGTPGTNELHIDHALLASPNIQLNSDCVTIASRQQLNINPTDERPWILHLRLPEAAMQPFPSNTNIADDPSFFFKAGATFSVWVTPWWDSKMSMGTTLTLSQTVFIDADMLNMNPVPEVPPHKGRGDGNYDNLCFPKYRN